MTTALPAGSANTMLPFGVYAVYDMRAGPTSYYSAHNGIITSIIIIVTTILGEAGQEAGKVRASEPSRHHFIVSPIRRGKGSSQRL